MTNAHHAGSPQSFRLLTLGGLSRVDSAGTALVAQRRRLALLALLSSARDGGISRDRLIAYLSPESTTESARHSLHQLLYYLRQQTSDDVFLGTDPLRLNLWETQGDLLRALAATRRRAGINTGYSPFLSSFVREEGRLAALTGDSAGAVRAYRHYLMFRKDPEPSVRPEVERVSRALAELLGRARP